jgi:hypothetical protein
MTENRQHPQSENVEYLRILAITTKKEENMQVNQKYLINRKFLLLLLMANFFFSLFSYIFYYLFNSGYPLVEFMVAPVGRLDDFYNSLYYPGENLTFTKANFTLYPLSVMIYKFFSFQNVHLAAAIFFVLNILFFVYALHKLTKNYFVVILAVTSYPFLFTLARGNNEILLVSLGILCYGFLNQKKYRNALTCILVQFLVEPFPTYALQFIPYFKKIKNQVTWYLFSGVVVILIIQFNSDTKQYIKELILGGAAYSSSLGPGTTLHTSSLSGTFQFIYLAINDIFPYENSSFTFFTRIIFILGMLGVLLFFFKYRTKIDLITSALLIISSYTLFFAVTFDYRLLHFVIPLGLILMKELKTIEKFLSFSIIVLFIPKPFILFTSINNSIGETLGSVVNPLVIIFIIALTLIRFFRYLPAVKN